MATIEQIKRRNKQAGLYFFSKDTMRFFNSIVYDETFELDDDATLFVTSEKCSDKHSRLYTIRCANANGSIGEFSRFQEYKTLQEALANAEYYASEEM